MENIIEQLKSLFAYHKAQFIKCDYNPINEFDNEYYFQYRNVQFSVFISYNKQGIFSFDYFVITKSSPTGKMIISNNLEQSVIDIIKFIDDIKQ